GYDTYFSGKWHVRANAEKAFDFVNHVRPGMPNQTAQGYNRPIEGQPDEWSPFDRKFDGFWKDGKHWSEVLGDDAIGYLAQAAKRDKPFFMYLAFNAPHDPRQSPKAYVDKYPLDRIKVPENYLSEYPYKEEMGAGKSLRDEKLAPFPRTKYAVKVNRQEYYAIITHMDAQIGRILEALEKSGKRDNTWIFFTADHGLAVGHHGLLGKQNLYDHSVRVPFMVVGPGVAANAKNNTPIYLQDVMPTSLELAKVERPDHVEFKSLLPVLSGAKTDHYDAIYGGYTDRQRMVTHDGYKLILYPRAKKLRLYHIDKDPLEMNDLAGEAKSQPVIKKLYEKFQELQRANGDKLDLALVFPQL
ncbi:MAG: sulfatase-like hydrolase/transferase, partial [Pirellulaceae bacterium]|nr:sulfatase-like hydrolase/transferase [Pirellulaceae bacterium]